MIRVALAVVIRNGRVLLARRRAGGHLPGMWELPGGKVRPGEEPSRAALRELREETGLVGERAEALLTVPYVYPDREVLLEVFQVTEVGGEASPLEGEEVAWLRPGEIRQETMPAANVPILQYLRSLPWGPGGTGAPAGRSQLAARELGEDFEDAPAERPKLGRTARGTRGE